LRSRHLRTDIGLADETGVLDLDAIREALIALHLERGSFPIRLDDFRPGGESISPLETGAIFQRETRLLRDWLFETWTDRIEVDGLTDPVAETTLSMLEVGSTSVRRLRQAGYSRVDVVLVDASLGLAEQRARRRWQAGVIDYLELGRGLDGRFVTPETTARYRVADDPTTSCARAYDELRRLGPPRRHRLWLPLPLDGAQRRRTHRASRVSSRTHRTQTRNHHLSAPTGLVTFPRVASLRSRRCRELVPFASNE
jgi:hypothetical protein